MSICYWSHLINKRGTYLVSKTALPFLKASQKNPHILNLSPPLNMKPKWFQGNLAYTLAKYGMSMCVLGKFSYLVNPTLNLETPLDFFSCNTTQFSCSANVNHLMLSISITIAICSKVINAS